jgi:hypothetical protein
MSNDQGDQTEAELERTRKVVAAAMAEQVATNSAAVDASPPVDDEADDEDLSSLLKAELVERAEAAGIDTEGKTKAELVAELEGSES